MRVVLQPGVFDFMRKSSRSRFRTVKLPLATDFYVHEVTELKNEAAHLISSSRAASLNALPIRIVCLFC